MKIPQGMRGADGGVKPGVMGTEERKVLVDRRVPTRPDMVVRLNGEKKIVIFEVACAWKPGVEGRELEKKAKYQNLAADLAKVWKGYRVTIDGRPGADDRLKRHLKRAKILDSTEIRKFMKAAQRETICSAVKIIERHMVADC